MVFQIKFESSDDEAMEKVEDHGGGSGESTEPAQQKSKNYKETSSGPHDEEMDASDINQKSAKAEQGDLAASGSKEQKERKRSKAELDDDDDNREAKETKKDRSESVDEKSERKKSEDRRERKDERFDKYGHEERREKPRGDDRREDRSDRYRNDDRRERSDDYRRKNYDSNVPYKKPRRDDFDDRGPHRDRDDRQGGRFDNRRRDDYRGRDRDDRDRFQRKDDRRDYGGPRRGDYRGGGGYRRGGPDRNGDRDGRWRGNDDRREKEDRSTWDVRPSAEEVAKQKKLLWGSKSAAAPSGEGSSGAAEASATEAPAAPSNVTKNAGLWASAITASGVAGDQANKFLKLMGVKNAPTVDPNSKEQINKPVAENRGEIAFKQAKIAVQARFACFHAKILSTDKSEDDNKRLQEESEKQKKMMRDLDRQYAIARETTHMGRGLGLGFHQ
ncbi:hypothetical protein Y032_0041g471 [Ancylostoma ceylanicum]|uniref:Small acidic protein-like domain-containing protein n=1 Tax=Ancylostoma ceylanicum TaxID=53326 RepID=A0A016UHJ9_9BILA|nr:hypothetical protein Y032_0041g471 [Ancylostoma ceylanicum]